MKYKYPAYAINYSTNGKEPWAEKDDAFLMGAFDRATHSAAKIAGILKRTHNAVNQRRNKLLKERRLIMKKFYNIA